MDPSLEEAARDLGAGPVITFFRVTLPMIMPGVMAGALLAFALSIDDYIITSFNNGQHGDVPAVGVRRGARTGARAAAGERDGHVDLRVRRASSHRRRGVQPPEEGMTRALPIRAALADAAPDVVLARLAGRARPGAAADGRHELRPRWSSAAATPASGRPCSPRSPTRRATCCCSKARTVGWAASGRNGGFCAAALTHGLANGRHRFPDEVADAGPARPGEPRRDRDGRGASTASTAASSAPASSTVATEPHQVEWLRDDVEPRRDGSATTRCSSTATRCAPRSTRRPTSPAPGTATDAALVDPARLAWGLRAACVRLGVRIAEDTPGRVARRGTARACGCAAARSVGARAPGRARPRTRSRPCCAGSARTSCPSTTTC